ncbi:hypothetical protein MLD38_007418 [Melastoma candidum]|uniref:Uncharacterized protein n=1 Tax=Melastoma candidum TaxID=119954 RepID=A0ACB9RR71_9MYRT|nr:hypothetical protein MLD38_007418 [Melastoma candidum]
MTSRILVALALASAIAFSVANANSEGDVLSAWKQTLSDPNGVLSSWDPTLVNPCTWLHVTCNNDNVVVRVDLGNAGLSGPLIPELGLLSNLQYLELYANGFYGQIPEQIGNLTKLVSLDLYSNRFHGQIPASIGKLTSLRFLRLKGNRFTGSVPVEVLKLVIYGDLQILDVSRNFLTGRNHSAKGTVTTIKQDPKLDYA